MNHISKQEIFQNTPATRFDKLTKLYFGSEYELLDGGMTLTIHIRKQIPCKYIESGHIPQV